MPGKSDPNSRAAQELIATFMRLPWKARLAVSVVILSVAAVIHCSGCTQSHTPSPEPTQPPAQPAEPPSPEQLVNVPPPVAPFLPGTRNVVFCLWNMENLFDDKDDKRRQPDEEYDRWFIENPGDRRKKYEKLASYLVKLNNGIGPDVVVGIEIESYRAAELLQQALNAALPSGAPRYEHVVMKELDAGRHMAPCIVSRLPLSGAQLLGKRQRILEAALTVNSHELRVIASHWTSQLSDDGKGKEGSGRQGYAKTIHAAYTEMMKANPRADVLVCGDFNDSPDSDSVYKTLHMIGDSRLVTPEANPPRLFGLLSGKSPAEFGTHYYNKPLIYDHIAVSPGMFDANGWGYDPNSVQVPTEGLIRSGARTRRPWRFGSEKDDALGRGYSDHFPVVVTLKVAP
jgi:endonuclease/exonuclease/phosphatase family metal-dependent hydrolase